MSQTELMKQKHTISEGPLVQVGDTETTPKEDILWMLQRANTSLDTGDTKHVKQLLNSIKLLVTHNMENT